MQQQLQAITIAVNDLAKMKNFYQEKFGWKPLSDQPNIAIFQFHNILLSLYPQGAFADYLQLRDFKKGTTQFYFTINLDSEKSVDDTFAELEKKAVNIIQKPGKVFWGGYSGIIADIENNYWEMAYNPFLKRDDNGGVITHL